MYYIALALCIHCHVKHVDTEGCVFCVLHAIIVN